MGLRFRKSFKIAPGVKLNLGSKSAGFSIGGKHGGVSWNSRSGSRVRASAPGTGLSYSRKLGGKKRRKKKSPVLGCLGSVLLAALVLAALASINWSAVGGVAVWVLMGLGLIAMLVGLIALVKGPKRKAAAVAPNSVSPPAEEAAAVSVAEAEPVARLNPEDYDEHYEVELARTELVFPRMPDVGALLELKPDPLYPRDAKAVKACWVYEGEERIAGYIKKSDADLRNLMREYWSAGGRVDAQVRYNYDTLGVFIGLKQ